MISGCISNMLEYILDSIISDTKSGFIKGRYIGENTRFIFNLIYYTESHTIPRLLILIDFEKAFESIPWDFIYQVLWYFNLGNYIINWVKILNTILRHFYYKVAFCLSNFPSKRGCRQGYPLVLYFFLLFTEILSVPI